MLSLRDSNETPFLIASGVKILNANLFFSILDFMSIQISYLQIYK